MYSFASTKVGYRMLWKSATVLPERQVSVRTIAGKIVSAKSRYQAIEARTSVPWFLVGCWHYRESDFNFGTYLGNGQTLTRMTTEVPVGRGPFASFEEGADDALKGLHNVGPWTIEQILYQTEEYNGEGYFHQNVNDPYVWSWTNHYTSGKYRRDHEFVLTLVDPQCGCAAILKELEASGVITLTFEDTIMPTQPPAVSTANATVTTTTTTTPFVFPAFNIAEIERALQTLGSVLPIVATFFPPLRIALPFIPIAEALLKMASEIEAAHAAGGDVGSVFAANLEKIAAQVRTLTGQSA